jgi:hypothetical protein
MDWSKRTPAEKAKYLNQQMEDIKQARALLDRFELVTQKWLRRLEKTKRKKG